MTKKWCFSILTFWSTVFFFSSHIKFPQLPPLISGEEGEEKGGGCKGSLHFPLQKVKFFRQSAVSSEISDVCYLMMSYAHNITSFFEPLK